MREVELVREVGGGKLSGSEKGSSNTKGSGNGESKWNEKPEHKLEEATPDLNAITCLKKQFPLLNQQVCFANSLISALFILPVLRARTRCGGVSVDDVGAHALGLRTAGSQSFPHSG